MRFGESEVNRGSFFGWERGERGKNLKENFGRFCKEKIYDGG